MTELHRGVSAAHRQTSTQHNIGNKMKKKNKAYNVDDTYVGFCQYNEEEGDETFTYAAIINCDKRIHRLAINCRRSHTNLCDMPSNL